MIDEIRERKAVNPFGYGENVLLTPRERDALFSHIDKLEQEVRQNRRWAADLLRGNEGLEEENRKLREFFETLFSDLWDLSFDGFDAQDIAERLGLLVRVPADEVFRADHGENEMFVWAWHPLATQALEGAKDG